MSLKPDDVSRPEPIKPIGGEEGKTGGPPTTPFESYMEKAGEKAGPKAPSVSPFDLAHGPTTLGTGPTFDTLLGQVKASHALLGDVSTALQTKDLKLKQSQR